MGWTAGPPIDPGLGLTRRERRAVKRAVWERWMEDPWRGGMYGVATIGVVVGVGVLFLLLEMLGARGWVWMLARLGLTLGGLFGVLILVRRWQRPMVYAELRARGYAVCGGCGYVVGELRVCPECGQGSHLATD